MFEGGVVIVEAFDAVLHVRRVGRLHGQHLQRLRLRHSCSGVNVSVSTYLLNGDAMLTMFVQINFVSIQHKFYYRKLENDKKRFFLKV